MLIQQGRYGYRCRDPINNRLIFDLWMNFIRVTTKC